MPWHANNAIYKFITYIKLFIYDRVELGWLIWIWISFDFMLQQQLKRLIIWLCHSLSLGSFSGLVGLACWFEGIIISGLGICTRELLLPSCLKKPAVKSQWETPIKKTVWSQFWVKNGRKNLLPAVAAAS